MSSYILFELVKSLVLLVIVFVIILMGKRKSDHTFPPFIEHIE